MRSPSLQGHLLAWTLGAITLVWASFIAIGLHTGTHEADELTDGHLASVAALLLAQQGGSFGTAPQRPRQGELLRLRDHDYQQSLSVVVWDAQGRLLTRTGAAPLPPFDAAAEGFATQALGAPPAAWRSFARWDPADRQRKVMVLLSVDERDDLAWDIAGQMVEPGLWLLPAVAMVLVLALRRGLRPLHALSQDVLALDVQQAAGLQAAHPQREFQGMVGAVNTLVQRYHEALQRERELAGELAHELRTPLASLVLQARALRDRPDAEAAARLEQQALRAGEVLSQLLALARASRTARAEAAAPLDLDALARGVVADYGQAALDAGHELALVSAGPFPLRGHAVLLELALRNLVENALAHTPAGTVVEVQLDAAAGWLQVCDSAATTPEPAAGSGPEPATARPVQALGLGLGHRVVDKVAAEHQARFAAVPPPPGFGHCYRLQFPMPR